MQGSVRGMLTAGLLAAVALTTLAACSSSGGAGDGRVSVVASTDVWGDIARQVGGSDVDVTSIISDPSADPHSYEADAQVKLAISKADVVIENGGGYDDFVDALLKSTDGDAAVINAVDVSGHTASAGGELNEHVWYDFPTVAKVATAVAGALGQADRGHAATYTANAATFTARLSPLEAAEATVEAAHAGTGVAITEPVPLYLLDACGLVDKTPVAFSEAIEEGTDVSASVLNDTLKLISSGEVAALVYNEQTSGPETERVVAAAEDAKVAVVPVTETLPANKDYLAWMSDNVAAVAAALGT